MPNLPTPPLWKLTTASQTSTGPRHLSTHQVRKNGYLLATESKKRSPLFIGLSPIECIIDRSSVRSPFASDSPHLHAHSILDLHRTAIIILFWDNKSFLNSNHQCLCFCTWSPAIPQPLHNIHEKLKHFIIGKKKWHSTDQI